MHQYLCLEHDPRVLFIVLTHPDPGQAASTTSGRVDGFSITPAWNMMEHDMPKPEQYVFCLHLLFNPWYPIVGCGSPLHPTMGPVFVASNPNFVKFVVRSAITCLCHLMNLTFNTSLTLAFIEPSTNQIKWVCWLNSPVCWFYHLVI